jgi:hypothetical protein
LARPRAARIMAIDPSKEVHVVVQRFLMQHA